MESKEQEAFTAEVMPDLEKIGARLHASSFDTATHTLYVTFVLERYSWPARRELLSHVTVWQQKFSHEREPIDVVPAVLEESDLLTSGT